MTADQVRTVFLAVVQIVACCLTFALEMFNLPGQIPNTTRSFNLIFLGLSSRLLRGIGFFGAAIGGAEAISEVYRGGEAALGFTCISLICAAFAGILAFMEVEPTKLYSKPSTWFFLSAFFGIAPCAYGVGIYATLQTSQFGPALYTSIVAIVLGLLFGCIEMRSTVGEPRQEEVTAEYVKP